MAYNEKMEDAMIGTEFNGYQIKEELGRGAMAVVYRATQFSMGRDVAIKLLHKSLVDQDTSFLSRFNREAQVVAKLQHPHILPVYDFGEFQGQPYLVMAYINGGTLGDYILKEKQLHLLEAARMVRQVARALEHAHGQEIIHRDIKPNNILLDEPGNVYLADFGLAKMMFEGQLTASGLVGTPAYMAPDWSAEGATTQAADIYSLGAMIYEMLSGEVPYPGDSPGGVLTAHLQAPIPNIHRTRPELPQQVQAVVETAMAKKPEERYATPGLLAAALDEAAQGLSVLTKPAPQPDSGEGYFYPNRWCNYGHVAGEELLGKEEHDAILIMAGYDTGYHPDNMEKEVPFERIGRTWEVYYNVLGKRGMMSLTKKIGEISFKMEDMPGTTRLLQSAIKVASMEARVRMAMKVWLDLIQKHSDQRMIFEETDSHWIYKVTRCQACWGWQADEPVCYVHAGQLQAALSWLSGGQQFRIVETGCMAMGDSTCTFMIDKKPRQP
ncbi:protein kinase [Chloroflexota bacterium]